MSAAPADYRFSFGQRLGLVFICESAALSVIAVSALLLWIAYNASWPVRDGHGFTAPKRWKISTHLHFYFLNLLLSDLIQAIGGLLDIKWILEARVLEGPLCTTQGIFKQIGDVGVAFSTMSIALHTFGVLVFGWHSPPKVALLVIACIWVFLALIIGIPLAVNGSEYYGNTQYWCWISEKYPRERIGLEYAWLYIAAFLNLIIYVLLALVIRGWLIVEGRKIRFQRGSASQVRYLTNDSERTRSRALAWHMMFYPIVYCVTVTPIAITRWMAFSGKSVPFSATAFASILFSASGLFNVLLYKFTRPKLLPTRERKENTFNGLDYWNPRDRHRRRASLHTYITDVDGDEVSPDFGVESWKRDPESTLRPTVDSVELSRIKPSPPTPVHLKDYSPPQTGVRITKEYHIN